MIDSVSRKTASKVARFKNWNSRFEKLLEDKLSRNASFVRSEVVKVRPELPNENESKKREPEKQPATSLQQFDPMESAKTIDFSDMVGF